MKNHRFDFQRKNDVFIAVFMKNAFLIIVCECIFHIILAEPVVCIITACK